VAADFMAAVVVAPTAVAVTGNSFAAQQKGLLFGAGLCFFL
jgi:hypothetical protein